MNKALPHKDLKSELTSFREQSRTLPVIERARFSCELSKRLEKIGEYEKAREVLSEFWPDTAQYPKVEGLDELTKAGVLLRAGALAGWLGGTDQNEQSQEYAKDLITESIEIFERLTEDQRLADARGELALCYWREGAYDEARINLNDARARVEPANTELKAVLLIRAGIVEVDSGQFSEAFRLYNRVKPLLDTSTDDALKGSFHLSFAILFRKLAAAQNNKDHIDNALIEYAAANFHFEQVGNHHYAARVENNLGFLFFTIKRYRDAHEHLDRARRLFMERCENACVAQVDETRAQTFLAEGRPRDAERIIKMAVRTLEKGGQQALLAEALTTQATVAARLGTHARARALFQKAIGVAETCGDLEAAGRARLSIIEELSNQTQARELARIFREAAEILQKSQDVATRRRLVVGGMKTIDALTAATDEEIESTTTEEWEGFSLRREMKKLEARFIQRALRDAGGSVSKASRLLGFKHHQSLISLLGTRHQDLANFRSVKRRRRQPLIVKPRDGEKSPAALDRRTAKLTVLHVEDQKTFGRQVEKLLAAERIYVDSFVNGSAAWQIMKSDAQYDALIVDNDLPGLSGLELVLRVRSLPKRRTLPIIMLADDDCEKEAWRAGVDAFLRKEEGLDQLPATLARTAPDRRRR